MIGWLLPIVARWGVPEPLRKLAAWATLVGAFLALCGLVAGAWLLWLHFHDKAIVAHHDAKVEAKVTKAVLHADRVAGAKKAARDRAEQAKQNELQEKADEAYHDGDDPLDAIWGGLWNDITSGGPGPDEATGLPAQS